VAEVVKVAVVGAGFAGAVLARALAKSGHFEVTVFDERPHVAGNCHTARDPETGVMVHTYGPHIFHTSREDVWDYVRSFGEFAPFTNRVKAVTPRGVFSLPINLHTINQFFGAEMTPDAARAFVSSIAERIDEPRNFEEQALSMIGRDLYETFMWGYTKKQWGVEPRELPASILKRLPVRFNYNDNYYESRFQGIPVDGYTRLVEKILDDRRIELRLGERFERGDGLPYGHVFYSGPIDAYFGHECGRLGYRTLNFERVDGIGDAQGTPSSTTAASPYRGRGSRSTSTSPPGRITRARSASASTVRGRPRTTRPSIRSASPPTRSRSAATSSARRASPA
jgi:UDP-galactopyranose mutase